MANKVEIILENNVVITQNDTVKEFVKNSTGGHCSIILGDVHYIVIKDSKKTPLTLEKDYDMYATFHNIRILNPRIEGDCVVADVFDIYDFAPGPVTDQVLAVATPVAVALQDNGIITNYKILTKVRIPIEALK